MRRAEHAPLNVRGLLVSQIGYDIGRPMRAIVRGPQGLLSEAAEFSLADDAGRLLHRGSLTPWGSCWGSAWWVADLPGISESGRYSIEVVDRGGVRFLATGFDVGHDLLWEQTCRWVGVEQAERRARLATNRVGWQDCGAAWQEANSHAAYIGGFCDLLEFAASRLSVEDVERTSVQIVNGCDYLALLQERATACGLGKGAVSHQTPRYEDQALASDSAKAALAWARASRLLPDAWRERRATYRARAEAAYRWARQTGPTHLGGFARVAHGAPDAFAPPPQWMTRDLLTLLAVAVELGRSGAEGYAADAVALAEEIGSRQIPESAPECGLHGHFRTYGDCSFSEKAWVHHLDGGVLGCDAGGHFSPDLTPFLRMLEVWPKHPCAEEWRRGLRNFGYGYLLPACRANPFGIAPLGCFGDEGLIHFAGLWHGMNAVYALTAALALDLERHFGDPAFGEVATGNLQWIAGLNAGVTRASLRGAHMFSMDVPEELALPASMICGIGRRWAGTWLNVRGAICNGFSTGDQFKFDVPPRREYDGPHSFTDEDWITHAGGWLSALARVNASRKPNQPS